MPDQDEHALPAGAEPLTGDSATERRYTLFFFVGLFFLLLWSAWDYGGRYLHVQAIAQVLSAGLVLMFALQLLRRGNMDPLMDYPLLRPGLLWLLALGLSWIFSVNRLASLEEIWRWVMYLLLALGVYGWLRLQARPEQGVAVLLSGTLLTGLVIVGIGLGMPSAESGLSSTFYRTNDLAGYLLLLVPLALHLLFVSSKLPWRLLSGLSFICLATALILTNSRSSWVAGLLACGLVLLLNRSLLRSKALRWSLLGSLALLLGGLVLNWSLVAQRLQTLTSLQIFAENATAWRLELLKGTWRMFEANPLLGTGPNTFATAFTAFQHQPGYYSINPHNFYLQTLAETGAIGFVALSVWLWAIGRHLMRCPNRYSSGVLAGLFASLMHIAFDIDWSISAIPVFFAGLLGAGLVPTNVPPSAPVPAGHQLNARPAGVLIFVCLGLALVPSLNYFSARSYSQAMALEAEQPEASAAALQQSIQLAPWPSGRHYSNLALQALSRNELEPALLAISRAIQLDYHNARYYGLAAEILLALERKPAALAMLLRRQELNPYRSPHIYTELGDFYLEQQDEPHEALRWYQRGLQIFTARALSHYERYTPSHRYEAFNLMMKQATLHEKLSQLPQAKALRAEAQLLLRGGGRDMFVKSGYGNPVEAVNAYWQQLPEHHRNPSHSFDSILPGSQIQVPPPQLLNAEGIRFLQAERDIFAATLVYVIPRQDRPDSWLLLEDRLIGNETGWKIGSRRKLSP